MQKMVAYCGLVCTSCPTFIATQKNDDALREKTAKFLVKQYGLHLKPEDINCDGCLSSGERLIGYCATCDIRKCAMDRPVAHCAVCDDQPCDKLDKFHAFSPEAKAAFEAFARKDR